MIVNWFRFTFDGWSGVVAFEVRLRVHRGMSESYSRRSVPWLSASQSLSVTDVCQGFDAYRSVPSLSSPWLHHFGPALMARGWIDGRVESRMFRFSRGGLACVER
ncbi:unnamed protein product [Calypogeia fissa]